MLILRVTASCRLRVKSMRCSFVCLPPAHLQCTWLLVMLSTSARQSAMTCQQRSLSTRQRQRASISATSTSFSRGLPSACPRATSAASMRSQSSKLTTCAAEKAAKGSEPKCPTAYLLHVSVKHMPPMRRHEQPVSKAHLTCICASDREDPPHCPAGNPFMCCFKGTCSPRACMRALERRHLPKSPAKTLSSRHAAPACAHLSVDI